MFPRITLNCAGSLTLLALAITLVFLSKLVASEFHTVDISSHFNADLRTSFGGSQYPVAPITISVGGVPFDLKPQANIANSLGIVISPLGPYNLVIPVHQSDVVAVYTLINSGFGTFGANNGLVEAIGTGGAYASFDLVQGTNIRDHAQNIYNNLVGPDIETANYGSVRLDRQVLLLPLTFQGQTLTEIRLTGTAGNPSGVPFVAGMTVEVTEPGNFDFDGDVDGRDFLKWQRGETTNPFSAGDLADWQENYGVASLTATSVAVPEPGISWVVLFLTGLATTAGRNKR